jgi:hypothetical protein
LAKPTPATVYYAAALALLPMVLDFGWGEKRLAALTRTVFLGLFLGSLWYYGPSFFLGFFLNFDFSTFSFWPCLVRQGYCVENHYGV